MVDSPIETGQIISKHQKVTSTRDKKKEYNDQYAQNDPDPPMNDSDLDKVLLVIAQWKQI